MPPYASVTSTDFTYTGQSDMSGTGLMDYKARLYSPCIMHFVQPDTLIPDIYNPQDWNRYSYARNNPLKYTDPTGHRICGIEDNNCEKIIVLERIKIQIDKEFDPFTGPLPDDFEYDDSKISEADMLIKKLYFDHSINWHELARNLESNTVTIELLLEWVDAEAPWYLIYGRVFRINANHVPYALFLAELGLPTDTDPHFMNYESNYLAALMANHARELERAKQVYLTQYALRDDYQLWLELFGEGAPWSTGD
jgi:RHS repeat-associated protein